MRVARGIAESFLDGHALMDRGTRDDITFAKLSDIDLPVTFRM